MVGCVYIYEKKINNFVLVTTKNLNYDLNYYLNKINDLKFECNNGIARDNSNPRIEII